MAAAVIVPAGDAALIVRLADRIDPLVNASVIALARALAAKPMAGVRDVVPAYSSVTVHFDPLRTDYAALVERLQSESAAATGTGVQDAARAPIRVPVCYGGDHGPDLTAVARFAGVTEADAIHIHLSRTYRVFMLGFVPGFTYMGIVDPRIAAPRLAVPRLRVPPGSVGIAGFQTGIYPAATPGGWQLVGRTPLQPFALDRPQPFMFEPGDEVQFYAIDPGDHFSGGQAES